MGGVAQKVSEPPDVRRMRWCLRRWPIRPGRGLMMRVFKPRVRHRQVPFEIEPGLFAWSDMDDWMSVGCFMCEHERDASFQLSFSLLRPGETAVDVGANIGIWATCAARRVGANGAVHAFEPVPSTRDKLVANLHLNGQDWVSCPQLALSDAEGEATIFNSVATNSGAASLAVQGADASAVRVKTTTLDDYVERHGIAAIDLLKIDVEGGEQLVVRGAERLLSGPSAPILFWEADDALARPFDSSASAVKRFLADRGYIAFRYDHGRLKAVPVDAGHEHEDLFGLKEHHFERRPELRAALER
jgi:FkbM family methyltransferase